MAPDPRLDGIDFADPAHGLLGDRVFRPLVHIEEFPPRMRETVSEFDRAGRPAWPCQFVIARVAVDLQHAIESPKVILEMRPTTIRRVKIDQDRLESLARYLEDGRLSIDNNLAERLLRGIAVSRKNSVPGFSSRW